MCCSFIFIRSAGIRHTASSNDISDHSAARSSTWPNKYVRGETKGGMRCPLATKAVTGSEQFADPARIDYNGRIADC